MTARYGVMVGCDQNSEWLLSWWWERYYSFNRYPITFANFGMSEAAQEWCKTRGELLTLSPDFAIASEGQMKREEALEGEAAYGKNLWTARTAWFQKPLAMSQSPYARTIWFDLDCEILGDVGPLFAYCYPGNDVALAKEPFKEGEYNSGVIVFKQSAELISRWMEAARERNGEFWGDQQLLSRLIAEEKWKIEELPALYNWRMAQGFNLDALIIHWAGAWGKEWIRQHGGLLGNCHRAS